MLILYSPNLECTSPAGQSYLHNLQESQYEKNKDDIALYIRNKFITPQLFSIDDSSFDRDSFTWNLKDKKLTWIFNQYDLRQ